jgi:PAP2 superfamily protein
MSRLAKSWVALSLILVAGVAVPAARADDVTDWNQTMLRAGLVAGTSPPNMTRVAAMVQAAVFDAVNGIDRRYSHIMVEPAAPSGASRRAAAVQAAYVMLSKLYGAAAPQQATFDARRAVSLAVIAERERGTSINNGIAWGQTVADAIWSKRLDDGFSTTAPFDDRTGPGEWRRTQNLPVSSALSPPGAGYVSISAMEPWVMTSPFRFRPGRPPALTTAEYTKDFNEVKAMGSLSSTVRSPDQTTYSLFWNSGTATYLWNRVALALIEARNRDGEDGGHDESDWRRGGRDDLLEHARLLAALDLAMADAAIGCWDAKYAFFFWRPITAIREAATDGNPDTAADPSWAPLFATPGHPDYPSGHSCVSGAAGAVLASEFRDRIRFSIESDLMIGVTRSFRSFSAALDEVKNARIFAGIHFRTACDVGQQLGASVAEFVLEQKFQRLR